MFIYFQMTLAWQEVLAYSVSAENNNTALLQDST